MVKSYLARLNDRDRFALYIGVSIFFVYLIYLSIVSPMLGNIRQKEIILSDKKNTLNWMRSIDVQPGSNTIKKNISGNDLLNLISKRLDSAPTQQFSYQLQQTDNGDIQIKYASVPFNEIMKKIQNLQSQYVFHIKSLSAKKNDTSGMVQLNLTLSS